MKTISFIIILITICLVQIFSGIVQIVSECSIWSFCKQNSEVHFFSIYLLSHISGFLLAHQNKLYLLPILQTHVHHCIFIFLFLFFYHSFILHCLESRTKPILTPCNGRQGWDSNLRTLACGSPALLLCYGRQQNHCIYLYMSFLICLNI